MKQYCICCDIEYENAAGFQTKQGFICMRHEEEKINVFVVSYSGMGDCVFKYKYDAESFIDDDAIENYADPKEYKITEKEMSVLEYNNLEDWDG